MNNQHMGRKYLQDILDNMPTHQYISNLKFEGGKQTNKNHQKIRTGDIYTRKMGVLHTSDI